ncbi:MAG: TrfA family protein [Acidobacteria bacterium]|nr:TrfA family protein [Acidobacteriota bacterium]
MSDPQRIDAELARALENLGRAVKANPHNEAVEIKPPAKIIQLPLWPEPVRGMPNPALRSALFSAIQSKDRRFIDHELISAVDGVEIRFLGKQLNQEDLDVCAQVFHLARLHPLGHICHTSAYGLLKSLGLSTGRTNHRQLHASLIRLQQPFEMKVGRYSYSGSLIEKGIKDELTRHYIIKVNSDLAPLFRHGWTGLDANQRRKIRGKPLALWLHAFYASHEKPYPYKVETLRDLCGSQTKTLKFFRKALRRALAELQQAGAIAAWEIDAADLVRLHKVPTITQKSRK